MSEFQRINDRICDALRGNTNRMCVTDDFAELMSMYTYAMLRINDLFNENRARIREQKKEERK